MKKHLGKIITGVGVGLAVVAILMMFAPAISVSVLGTTETVGKGTEIAFGSKEGGYAVSAYMLPYLVTIIGAVCGVLAILGKGGNKVRIAAAVALLIGGVLFFLPKVMAMPDLSDIPEEGQDYVKEQFKQAMDAYDIGAGAIVGGLFSILGAAAVIVPMFVCKENN